jgi:hypothetical protein
MQPMSPLHDRKLLDDIVYEIEEALSNPVLRTEYSQRAVQCKVWHERPILSKVLMELRSTEEKIRRRVLDIVSSLVYYFHGHSIEATMIRAGIKTSDKTTVMNPSSSLRHVDALNSFDTFCLDSKERLYMTMQSYDWLNDLLRLYPLHFFENSSTFVQNIPKKHLPVKVKVVGLGIGGSVACSGLAKYGIAVVQGYEKRSYENGPKSVTSRYQNASWRAYDVASKLVNEKASEALVQHRQHILMKYDDGTENVVTSDRVQIVLGYAIDHAIQSAKIYGAQLFFDSKLSDYYNNDDVNASSDNGEDHYDLVALFSGARTCHEFDGLNQCMNIHEWSSLYSSKCKMWLQIKPSTNNSASYCTRGGEIGCEKWHYTIESTRHDINDLYRVQHNQLSQYQYDYQKLEKEMYGEDGDIDALNDLKERYETQKHRLQTIIDAMKRDDGDEEKETMKYYDYIFTNAPANDHNLAKREAVDEHVVLDGEYTVDLKIAANSTFTRTPVNAAVACEDVADEFIIFDKQRNDLLNRFHTDAIVCGGDACVPPNPLAAYGATLACEAAGNVVQLAISIGHLNAILKNSATILLDQGENEEEHVWMIQQTQELKSLFLEYYEAKSRSENYFQWVQTCICNLYSVPSCDFREK